MVTNRITKIYGFLAERGGGMGARQALEQASNKGDEGKHEQTLDEIDHSKPKEAD